MEPETILRLRGSGSFERATERCVGVGACLKKDGGVMCPSYRATGEEQHSTRGRARLLWEMLAGALRKEGFQSEAVHEALDLCLSCKACKTECPVQVDMAQYKSEFLAQKYKGKAASAASLCFWICGQDGAAGLADAGADQLRSEPGR
jgi:Fe-S oxidoreductase